MDVLGLPVAEGEVEVVDQGAVNDDAFVDVRVDGVLGNEGPADLAGAVFEEGLEGGADGGLVGEVEVGEAVEGGGVGVYGLVGGCGVEGGHWNLVLDGWRQVRLKYNTPLATFLVEFLFESSRYWCSPAQCK